MSDGASSAVRTDLTRLMAPILFITYLRLARREEREMITKFVERYLAYRAHTPAFMPSWNSFRKRPASVALSEQQL